MAWIAFGIANMIAGAMLVGILFFQDRHRTNANLTPIVLNLSGCHPKTSLESIEALEELLHQLKEAPKEDK